MNRYLAIVILTLALVMGLNIAYAQQTVRPTAPLGLPLADSTSAMASVPNTATTVTLDAPSTNVTIFTLPSAATLHVQFKGTAATTSNFPIPAGYSFTFTGLPEVKTFSVIGDSATGSFAYFAH